MTFLVCRSPFRRTQAEGRGEKVKREIDFSPCDTVVGMKLVLLSMTVTATFIALAQ